MNTSKTIHDQVTAARQKLADLNAASQAETEKAQAEVQRLDTEAAKVAEAERRRVHKRGRVWAADYIAHSTERVEQRKELRDAERALREALADEPWVKALTDWHRARRRADLIRERESQARAYLDMTPLNPVSAPESAAHWNNGVPSPAFFLGPLLDVIDGTVDDELEAEREARASEIHALLHAPDGKGDPLAKLPKPRHGQVAADPRRIETTRQHAPDGTVILAHRSIDDNSITYTHENGEPYKSKDADSSDDS